MTRSHTFIKSPIDTITLVASEGVLCGLYMNGQRNRPNETTLGDRRVEPFARVAEQLAEYFDGNRTSFDIELAPTGDPFQLAVWEALRTIPYGETATYGEIAARVGKPGAARTVGTINGQNPISIIVPCHRVIGASGKLTGYNGGLERKEFLLGLERRQPAPRLFESSNH